jgi:hypothetical protein
VGCSVISEEVEEEVEVEVEEEEEKEEEDNDDDGDDAQVVPVVKMKMAESDAANVEVMEDVDIMPQSMTTVFQELTFKKRRTAVCMS